jgi:hypothetical protein
MLTRFRSVLSVSKVHLFLMFFAFVLAVFLSVSVDESWARMEEPVPAPHLEGWPEPQDDHVTDGRSPSLSQAKDGSGDVITNSRPGNLEWSSLGVEDPTSHILWVAGLLYRIHLLP